MPAKNSVKQDKYAYILMNSMTTVASWKLSNSWTLLNSLRMHSKFPLLWVDTKLTVFNFKEFLLFHIHHVCWQPCPLVFRHAHTCLIPGGHSILQTEFPTFHLWPFNFFSFMIFFSTSSEHSILDLEIVHSEYFNFVLKFEYMFDTQHSTLY